RPFDWPARPQLDVPASDPLRANHAEGGRTAAVAWPVRVPAAGGPDVSEILNAIRDLIQQDIGSRGLATDPAENLLTLTASDFASACRGIAGSPRQPSLVVVTGFWIPQGTPPAGETDGPLGALFLARALAPLGFRVVLATDAFCLKALE